MKISTSVYGEFYMYRFIYVDLPQWYFLWTFQMCNGPIFYMESYVCSRMLKKGGVYS